MEMTWDHVGLMVLGGSIGYWAAYWWFVPRLRRALARTEDGRQYWEQKAHYWQERYLQSGGKAERNADDSH